ncbi:MAG: hypothetical protein KatS3mg022_0342 [Armatimonadota bacterium]|nr:MAG: hypothetical protein KatS3mg022_0342 [Armatimonadota bacterium]
MKRAIIIAVILIIIITGGSIAWSRLRNNNQPKPEYRTAKVERGTVTKSVTAEGTLQPLTVVDVKSKAGGMVTKLAVDVGTEVKAGQLIARIDPTDTMTMYEQARADLEAAEAREQQSRLNLQLQAVQSEVAVLQAQANLESAKARLEQARRQLAMQPKLSQSSIQQAEASYETALENLRQLQEVTIPQTRTEVQAQYEQAKANYENAEKNLARQEELLRKGFVSQQAVDTARTQRDVAKAQFDMAQKRLSTLERDLQATLRNAEKRLEEAKAALESARTNAEQVALREADVRQAEATVKQAEAALKQAEANALQNRIREADIRSAQAQKVRSKASLQNAQEQLRSTTIVAPRDGVVIQKYVEEGTIIPPGTNVFSQGTSIVQIADISRMFVDVQVDETDVAFIQTGQKVDVTLDAYPSEIFEGTVTRIDPRAVVEQNVTVVHVRVEIENPDARLKPGMNATCEFVVDRKENVLMVPAEAVKENDGKYYVQVMEGGEPRQRDVEIGLEGNDTVEIVSGLKEGEEVVTQVIQPQTQQQSSGGPPRGMGMPMFGGPPMRMR